jgi:hypothetical protein
MPLTKGEIFNRPDIFNNNTLPIRWFLLSFCSFSLIIMSLVIEEKHLQKGWNQKLLASDESGFSTAGD